MFTSWNDDGAKEKRGTWRERGSTDLCLFWNHIAIGGEQRRESCTSMDTHVLIRSGSASVSEDGGGKEARTWQNPGLWIRRVLVWANYHDSGASDYGPEPWIIHGWFHGGLGSAGIIWHSTSHESLIRACYWFEQDQASLRSRTVRSKRTRKVLPAKRSPIDLQHRTILICGVVDSESGPSMAQPSGIGANYVLIGYFQYPVS